MKQLGRHGSPVGDVNALKYATNSYWVEILGHRLSLWEATSVVVAIEDAQRDIENDSADEWGRQ